jgi:hypothetical protein
MENAEFCIQNPKSKIQNPKSKIQNPKLSQPVPQNYLDGPLPFINLID